MRQRYRNAVLIDSTHPLHENRVNILVTDGQLTAITTNDHLDFDQEVVFEQPTYVSAGWIDIHVHCFQSENGSGVDPDDIGVNNGVVCVVDAGSAGPNTIDAFYQQVKHKKTVVKAWMNAYKDGLADMAGMKHPENIDVDLFIEKMQKYSDFVVGTKILASESRMGKEYQEAFIKTSNIKEYCQKPTMVHIGNMPPTYDYVLQQVTSGDIITHCFHGKKGNLIEDNKVRKMAIKAREAGVHFDVGHGTSSFSYDVASQAKDQGFYPNTISTDIYRKNIDKPVGSLASVMSKFLQLGYSLTEVISMVTKSPSEIVKLQPYGQLIEGEVANLTFFRVINEPIIVEDSEGKEIQLKQSIRPIQVILNNFMIVL